MNLLPCRIDGNAARVGDAAIVLASGLADRIPAGADNDTLQLGIRPQFLELYDRQAPESVPVTVTGVEDLGNYQLVLVRLGNQALTVKVPEDQPVPTDRAHLRFPPEWTRLYADNRLVQ